MGTALLAGASALRAHQQMLDVIGDNVANLNTTGFKGSTVRFTELFSKMIGSAMPASDTRGGVNPSQIGYGVTTGSINVDWSQGNMEATGNPFDMAIQGNGFFALTDGTQSYYSRVGAFTTDETDTLVDTVTGYRVQDVSGSSIVIPYNDARPATPTSQVNISGNLDAASLGPLEQQITTITQFKVGGAAAAAADDLNDLDSSSQAYANGDTVEISGTATDGSTVQAQFVYGTTGTTLGELVSFIDTQFANSTAALDTSGNLVITADDPGEADLALALSNGSGNTGSVDFAQHSMTTTQEGRLGDSRSTSIAIYDSLGRSHLLSLTLTKTGLNKWQLNASVPADEGTMTVGQIDEVTFNENGSFQGSTGSTVAIQFDGLSGAQTIALDLGSAGKFDGMTQFGSSSTAVANYQDGATQGFLNQVSVRSDGTIEGIYTNGEVVDIASLQLATFRNPNGLIREGDSLFSQSSASGMATPSAAGTGNAGSIIGGSLEQSNVELTDAFTRMIIAQRGFQVNARTVTTADEVLQELVNIVR